MSSATDRVTTFHALPNADRKTLWARMQSMSEEDVERVLLNCLPPMAYRRRLRRLRRRSPPVLVWPTKDVEESYEGLTFAPEPCKEGVVQEQSKLF